MAFTALNPIPVSTRRPNPARANPFVPMVPTARKAILVAFGLYLVVLLIGGTLLNRESSGSQLLALCSTIVSLSVLMIPVIFYRSSYGICHPLVFTALYTCLTAAAARTPVYMYGLNSHSMLPDFSSDDMQMLYAYSNVVNIVANGCIYIGFLCGPKIGVPRLNCRSQGNAMGSVWLLGAFAISVGVFLLYAKLNGGFSTMLLNMAKGGEARSFTEDVDSIGQYVVPIKFSTAVALLWLVLSRKGGRDIIFVGLAGVSLVMCYLSTGKRAEMIYPAIVLGLGWVLLRQKMPYFRVLMAGVACFLLLGLMGLFRGNNMTRSEVNFDFLSSLDVTAVASATTEEFSRRGGQDSTFYPILARVPWNVDMLYGKSYLENFYRFIPRFMWPLKPRGIGVQAARTFADAYYGMPPGAVGEAYWNFALPGVAIVFTIFGVFLRWLASLLEAYPRAPAVMVFYVMTLFYLSPTQDAIRMWIQLIIPCVILMRIMGLWKLGSVPRKVAAPARTPA